MEGSIRCLHTEDQLVRDTFSFKIDEDSMAIGVEIQANIIMDYLNS